MGDLIKFIKFLVDIVLNKDVFLFIFIGNQ